MNNWLIAYGDKVLMWLIGFTGLLAVPATAQALHLNPTALAWIIVAEAGLNLAHGIFYPPIKQQAAKLALRGAWPPSNQSSGDKP